MFRSNRHNTLTSVLLLAVVLSIGAVPARANSVVTQWLDATLTAVRRTKPDPPVTARALAIVQTCEYDAWTAYDSRAVPTRPNGVSRRPLLERNPANKNKAISYAAYRALTDLFKEYQETDVFDALMQRLGYDPYDQSTNPKTPAGIGNLAAAAVLDYRHHDGANQLGDYWGSDGAAYSDYTQYKPVNSVETVTDFAHWQPLRVKTIWGGYSLQTCACPQWPKVVPFALTSPSEFRPGPPPSVSSPQFRAETQQLLEYSAHLTDKQKVIAEYWRDGPRSEEPPGHWCLFAKWISHRNHYGVDDDTKLFFALTNALFDVGIACWDAKIHYDFVRPLAAIHTLFHGKQVLAWAGPGQGTRLILADDWQPYQPITIVTPPFPEYCSGHSSFSAAAAEILRSYTGSDRFGYTVTIPARSSQVEMGVTPAHAVTLAWPTFSSAADEAGLSRRYGGIHFESGDLVGRRLGRQVGAYVWRRALGYFHEEHP